MREGVPALYGDIDEVLTGHWDPMGVFVLGDRLDEYVTFLSRVYVVALSGERDKIASVLAATAENELKLNLPTDHHLAIAEMIVVAVRNAGIPES